MFDPFSENKGPGHLNCAFVFAKKGFLETRPKLYYKLMKSGFDLRRIKSQASP